MKSALAAAAVGLLVTLSLPVLAQAATVSVTVGPELQKQTRAYGDREIADLVQDLRKTVQKQLDKAGPAAPQKVDLVLEAATPNRPTLEEMSNRPGLSLESVGLGGAAISGSVVAGDGSVRPISYKWFETDLRMVRGYTTWTDAYLSFDRLAHALASGKTPNDRPYHPDLNRQAAFSSWRN